MNLRDKIIKLQGPILIIGASGFVGRNLLKICLEHRSDVFGTFFTPESWRLQDIPDSNITYMNLNDLNSVHSVMSKFKPKVIFDCSSYGAYSFESEFTKIQTTNYLSLIQILELVCKLDIDAYVHAGSSSEYGLNAAAPKENDVLIPNSHYAVSKAAASQAITYYGKIRQLPVVNLRLYSVYGPFEDSSRLIPILCQKALVGELPTLANRNVTRDFIYIHDVVEAFIDAALNMNSVVAGESINIGTGIKTSLSTLANISKQLFDIKHPPIFDIEQGRIWDVDNWYCDATKARDLLNWCAKTPLKEGLIETFNWWKLAIESHDISNNALMEIQSKSKQLR